MKSNLFDDIPGVGEINIYRKNPVTNEENLWLDEIAFYQLNNKALLPIEEFLKLDQARDLKNILEFPFQEK